MTTKQLITFSQESLARALSEVLDHHHVSVDLIASAVFRQLPQPIATHYDPTTASTAVHGLNQAEGEQPDLNTSTPGADEPPSATPQPDKAQLCGWIKCSDRLPGDHLDGLGVIVAVVTAKGERISELDVWNKGRQSGRFEFWGKKVSHWQPLPAAPGGQQ